MQRRHIVQSISKTGAISRIRRSITWVCAGPVTNRSPILMKKWCESFCARNHSGSRPAVRARAGDKNPVHVLKIESTTGNVEPAAGAFAVPMNRRCGLNGVKTGLKDRRRILSHGFKRFDIRVHIFSTFRPSVCNSLIPESKIRQSKRAGSVFEKPLCGTGCLTTIRIYSIFLT